MTEMERDARACPEYVQCPQCGGFLTCGTHTSGVTCNGTSSTRREAAWHGYTPDVLRSIARIDIGGNAPWLADELTDLAGRLEQEMNGVSTYRGDDEDDPQSRQSTTACCPRETIPDSCGCLDGCSCLCRDCDCGDWGEEPY